MKKSLFLNYVLVSKSFIKKFCKLFRIVDVDVIVAH
jgi:hypothetical protein